MDFDSVINEICAMLTVLGDSAREANYIMIFLGTVGI